MIRSFRHKGLKALFETGTLKRVPPSLQWRIIVRLDALEAAANLRELNQPGFDFHPLRGKPQRYSIHVNGPWCVTFEWIESSALHVDLEQYH
jgi:proteic killer suppression protein